MSSPAVAACPASVADVDPLAELYRRAAAELAEERGGAMLGLTEGLPEPLAPELERRLGSGAHLVLAGKIDDVAVGLALVRCDRLADGSKNAVVEALYVEPGARGIGVGEAMLEEIVAWSQEQSCRSIDAPALPGMRESKNFFEVSGFVARLLVMHRRLDPQG